MRAWQDAYLRLRNMSTYVEVLEAFGKTSVPRELCNEAAEAIVAEARGTVSSAARV